MIPGNEPPNPFGIVAEVLRCSPASLSMDSAMYRDHGWDSFGHVRIIQALEKVYNIRIDNDTIEKYITMRAIQELYEQVLRGGDRRDG